MQKKTWGPEIWESKAQHHSDAAVIMGTGASQAKIDKNTRSIIDRLNRNFLVGLPKTDSGLLDVGVGPSARFTIALTQMGYQVTGLDGSNTALDRARSRINSAGIQDVELVQADFSRFDLGRKFSGIFCVETFFHIPAHLALSALNNFNNHLNVGGLLFVQFSILNEFSFRFLLWNLIYSSIYKVLKPLLPFFGKKAFFVTVTRHSDVEVMDLVRLAGFSVEHHEDGFYFLKKVGEPLLETHYAIGTN